MEILSLNGIWVLKDLTDGSEREGRIPGCDYTDFWRAGEIPDPYVGTNEYACLWLGRHDVEYSRGFSLSAEQLAAPHCDLVLRGVDTLGEISVNGKPLAKTSNAHRTYRFDVKGLLREGENSLAIRLAAPLTAMERAHKKRAVARLTMSEDGSNCLRKPICHTGWDWGPEVPISGVDEVSLELYRERLGRVRVLQEHSEGRVVLRLKTQAAGSVSYTLTAPNGETLSARGNEAEIIVENPELWWCNGLGEQPLYTLTVLLRDGDELLDTRVLKIGLRSIKLDTGKTRGGSQFRFAVNGVPIFARGANWIPADSMPGRGGKEKLRHLIQSAKDANMNMLRVWGGGYYESEEFYSLCDELGILVWQDCAFACALYPLDEPEYLENVRLEIEDNIERIAAHASLALICGNNEVAQCAAGFFWTAKKLFDQNNRFYFHTLRAWVAELAPQTPYWGSSPCNGDSPKNALNRRRGDQHIWSVWHGMLPLKAYAKMQPRFCSEFGLESFPHAETLGEFAAESDWSLENRVLFSHQKCRSGNRKILYYMLSLFGKPRDFSDFAYLSQLTQAEGMRLATQSWRARFEDGICNGALYWQFNDCWHTASWSGLDYTGRWKALQYAAKRFNAPLTLWAERRKNKAIITIVNDTRREAAEAVLQCRIVTEDGRQLAQECFSAKGCGTQVFSLPIPRSGEGCFLLAQLKDGERELAQFSLPLEDERKTRRADPQISLREVREEDGRVVLVLTAKSYARFVELTLPGIVAPFSDNYFDLPAGCRKAVTISLPEGESAFGLAERLQIRCLNTVQWQGTPKAWRRERRKIFLSKETHSFRNCPLREEELPA